MATGLGVVFAGGVTWLTLYAPGRSLQTALAAGFYPFVLVDLFKLAVGATVMPAAWKLLGTDFAD
jgi:biotin transport system substrate-specific component